MKLYQVPRNSKIRVKDTDIIVPPGSHQILTGEVLDFKHCDGMYSYCFNGRGDIVHIAAWTEVEIVEGQGNEGH